MSRDHGYLLVNLMGSCCVMDQQNGFVKFMKLIEVAEENNETAEECVNINYYGMKKVTEALLPLLQQVQSPRIVNITSIFGQLRVRNPKLSFYY